MRHGLGSLLSRLVLVLLISNGSVSGDVTLEFGFAVVGLFVSILGIPVALVIAKSMGTYFNPVNKKCVAQAVANELEKRKGERGVAKHLHPGGPTSNGLDASS